MLQTLTDGTLILTVALLISFDNNLIGFSLPLTLLATLPDTSCIVDLIDPVVNIGVVLFVLIHGFVDGGQVDIVVVARWLVVQRRLVVKGRCEVAGHEVVHLLELAILLLVVGVIADGGGAVLSLDCRIFVRH